MADMEKGPADSADNRTLGDEWEDWDGHEGGFIDEGKWLFLAFAALVLFFLDVLICLLVYMISPRISAWNVHLPWITWIAAALFVSLTLVWLVEIALTVATGRNFLPFRNKVQPFFDFIFSGAFRLAKMAGVSRDRMGHSFVKAHNEISRATKPHGRAEKLLILLPRCLTKDQLKEINSLKEIYPIFIHVVSGGELARKRIKEVRPTAVIGVACERDLISGIRDVGRKISLIGIPNKRPEGPCQNTHIDMAELVRAIEFYMGPQTPRP